MVYGISLTIDYHWTHSYLLVQSPSLDIPGHHPYVAWTATTSAPLRPPVAPPSARYPPRAAVDDLVFATGSGCPIDVLRVYIHIYIYVYIYT